MKPYALPDLLRPSLGTTEIEETFCADVTTASARTWLRQRRANGSLNRERRESQRAKSGNRYVPLVGRSVCRAASDTRTSQVRIPCHCSGRSRNACTCTGQSCRVAGSKSAPFGQTKV